MKKHILLLLLIAILMITACSTSVSVSYMRPSNVNTGSYRNLAIASTVPFSGKLSYPQFVRYIDINSSKITISTSYSRTLPKDVSSYATKRLVSTLSNTGYFNILSPQQTDKYLNLSSIGYNPSKELLSAGYDAVMIPKIEYMDIDEYIGSMTVKFTVDSNGIKQPVLEFYIKRVANITYSITIIDCKTEKIVSKRTYKDSIELEEDFNPKSPVFSYDGYYLFTSMLNGFQSDILADYVPARIVDRLTLMSNKPKIESLKIAYEYADQGAMRSAYELFLDEWNNSSHIPSGYNAALILSSMGNYDGALSLLEEMMATTVNGDVERLYRGLLRRKASTEQADKQISGEAPSPEISQGFTIYDYVMNT